MAAAIAGSAGVRAEMEEASRALARPEAAERVVQLCRELVESGGGGR